MLSAVVFGLLVALGVLGCLELGRRIGLSRRARGGKGAHAGVGVVDNAVYGLLSLMFAFTFSGAASRFEGRRKLLGDEANAIATFYARLDLLLPETREPLKAKVRDYVDQRILVYRDLPDLANARVRVTGAQERLRIIWLDAIAVTESSGGPQANVLLPPINDMASTARAELVAAGTHPPAIVYVMLVGLSLASALLGGYRLGSSKQKHVLHVATFTIALAGTAFVIMDLEYPLLGLFRADTHILVELRSTLD